LESPFFLCLFFCCVFFWRSVIPCTDFACSFWFLCHGTIMVFSRVHLHRFFFLDGAGRVLCSRRFSQSSTCADPPNLPIPFRICLFSLSTILGSQTFPDDPSLVFLRFLFFRGGSSFFLTARFFFFFFFLPYRSPFFTIFRRCDAPAFFAPEAFCLFIPNARMECLFKPFYSRPSPPPPPPPGHLRYFSWLFPCRYWSEGFFIWSFGGGFTAVDIFLFFFL